MTTSQKERLSHTMMGQTDSKGGLDKKSGRSEGKFFTVSLERKCFRSINGKAHSRVRNKKKVGENRKPL